MLARPSPVAVDSQPGWPHPALRICTGAPVTSRQPMFWQVSDAREKELESQPRLGESPD